MVCTVYVGDNLAIDITGGWTISPTVMGSTETLITITYNGVSTTQRMTLPTYLPTLEDNSWATIAAAAKEGVASSTWTVGDTKTLTIDGKTYTAIIVAFNHDNLDSNDPNYQKASYNNGKAGYVHPAAITFMIKESLKQGTLPYDENKWSSDSNYGGCYDELQIHTTFFPSIVSKMQSDVANNLKICSIACGNSELTSNYCTTVATKMWLPSPCELNVDPNNENLCGDAADVYPYFSAGNSIPFAPVWTRTNAMDNNYSDKDNQWNYIPKTTSTTFSKAWQSASSSNYHYMGIFCI